MKQIQDSAALFFIICVFILSAISILGVWKIFSADVITKSFKSIGVLAAAAAITVIAGKFIDSRKIENSLPSGLSQPMVSTPNAMFTGMRHMTLFLLIAAVSLLALFGILAIWEIMSGEVLYRSLASMAIVAFGSLIIVMTCLEREDHPLLKKAKGTSIGGLILLLFIGAWVFSLLFSSMSYLLR